MHMPLLSGLKQSDSLTIDFQSVATLNGDWNVIMVKMMVSQESLYSSIVLQTTELILF